MHAREVAQHFGYVPQNYQDTFPATVMDTILMGRKPYASWRFGREDIMKVLAVMRQLHLEEFALRSHSELSGGQRQKVMIARAFAQESQILLFDEPTSQLDIRHQLEIMDLVQETVQARKILAIIVVHDLNLASRYADRILMLREGRIVATGTPAEVLTEETIRMVYGVESLVMHDGQVPCVVPKRRL
jgi:iron complex transport system ATP-binding protein